MPNIFTIEKHSAINKSFGFFNDEIYLSIDYDDVNHVVVDAATELMKEILDEHWDEEKLKQKVKEKAMEKWHKNEYNLQNDYSSFEEYMVGFGL